jgi:Rad3-related DNA helicase
MFCVVKAKLSEGIDFKDKLCRSVIFIGIPFMYHDEPYNLVKKVYLNQTNK